MTTIRLTAAQAMARYMTLQMVRMDNGDIMPLFAGIWAIFGHGNVAGLGEAFYNIQDKLPTYRGHNEQTMAHAAIAYSKSLNRKRVMAVTSSIGPGATNMVTAAALAHVNRLPVLFLIGEVFANRRPDPVLQQIEDFYDPTITANDAFRPVSKYWDRITRPEQLLTSLPRAMAVLTDAAECGPVTLSLCQDVQAEAYDYPEEFFIKYIWEHRRMRPDITELEHAAACLMQATQPLIIAGGGVIYSGASKILSDFAKRHAIPVAETQAGKSALPWDHPLNVGSIGVTGSDAANMLAKNADVILGIGTRMQDFTSGSRALFSKANRIIIQLNITVFDGKKHGAKPLICDAREGVKELSQAIGNYTSSQSWREYTKSLISDWAMARDIVITATDSALPSDAQVLAIVNASLNENAIIVAAAGGIPGELHKLWRASKINSYHVEYGYSCMGYEIAAGLGIKMAHPNSDVVVAIGDGSYMMANSELATSVMLGHKIILVILDNRGFGCINRLQISCGNKPFNNLLDDTLHDKASNINFVKHAESLGAAAEKVISLDQLGKAMTRAIAANISYVIVIDTDPMISTKIGGAWWDVAVPEISENKNIRAMRNKYEQARNKQRLGN